MSMKGQARPKYLLSAMSLLPDDDFQRFAVDHREEITICLEHLAAWPQTNFLVPGHPYWGGCLPDSELVTGVTIIPGPLHEDYPFNEPLAEIMLCPKYIPNGWYNRPQDQALPFVHLNKDSWSKLNQKFMARGPFAVSIWQAIRTIYPWLAGSRMFPDFLALSIPHGLMATITVTLGNNPYVGKGIGYWEIGRSWNLSKRSKASDLPDRRTERLLGDLLAEEKGEWHLYDDERGEYNGVDPVAGLLDPDNRFSWMAKAWLEPLAAADAALQDFLAGTASLNDVLQRTRAKMVLSRSTED